MKILAQNKKAKRNYQILDKIEAGLVLSGPEVKSVKRGTVDLSASFAVFKNNELFLIGSKISPYPFSKDKNYDPERSRKLLLNKRQVKSLLGKTKQRNLTLIPLKIYSKSGWLKVELGLGKGRKDYQKKELIKRKTQEREIQGELKKYR